MKSKTTSTILKGAVILSVTSLLVKILSAFYRIPFQNMVGNEGFYVYQQVYPIYGIAMTLALSGVPVFISRVIAEYDEPAERIMVARRLFSILLVVAWGLFAGLQLFAPQLASVMGDGGLTAEIRAATWLFVLVPFFWRLVAATFRVNLIWYPLVNHSWPSKSFGWASFSLRPTTGCRRLVRLSDWDVGHV